MLGLVRTYTHTQTYTDVSARAQTPRTKELRAVSVSRDGEHAHTAPLCVWNVLAIDAGWNTGTAAVAPFR